jgi:hypothetical protein
MKLFGGSRYWQNAFVFQVLAFGWAAYVVHEATGETLGLVVGPLALMLGGVGTTIFGLMGMVKKKQSEPGSQQAYLERMKFEDKIEP